VNAGYEASREQRTEGKKSANQGGPTTNFGGDVTYKTKQDERQKTKKKNKDDVTYCIIFSISLSEIIPLECTSAAQKS